MSQCMNFFIKECEDKAFTAGIGFYFFTRQLHLDSFSILHACLGIINTTINGPETNEMPSIYKLKVVDLYVKYIQLNC